MHDTQPTAAADDIARLEGVIAVLREWSEGGSDDLTAVTTAMVGTLERVQAGIAERAEP